jgi:hypothetical protein
VSDQARHLSLWLKTHFERREIYHELGNNGLISVNPGRIRGKTEAGDVGRGRVGKGGRGGKEEGGGTNRVGNGEGEGGGTNGAGNGDKDGGEEGGRGSTGDVVKGSGQAVNGAGAGDKGVSKKSSDLM